MEQAVEQRDIVFKVKHGDDLRRFAAHISGNSMDLNMSNLRTKVIHLFKFKEDADLLLTYADIDGDVVTLSSDDELYDAAIFQRLNPLRITVHVNGDASKNSATNTRRNPPSSRSMPGLEFLPPQVSLVLEESLRNMPEPVRSTVTKISEEVSKATAASPVMTEVKDFLANLGNLHNVGTPGNSSPSQKDMGSSSNPKDANASSNPEVANVSSNPEVASVPSNPEVANVSSKLAAPADLLSDLTLPNPGKLLPSALVKGQIKTGKEAEAQKVDARDRGKFVAATASFPGPIIDHQQHIGVSSEPSTDIPIVDLDGSSKKPCESNVPPTNFHGNIENGFISSQRTSPVPPVGCHYGGWNHTSEFGRRGPPGPHDGWMTVSHRGVVCDACGMHPIVGPRYKSKVLDNYDLCQACFSEIGNEMDYSLVDRPIYRPPRPFRGRGYIGPHQVLNSFRNCGVRHPKEKLESRFIQDVTILDGTLIEPSTEFTKIWRLRNSGSTSWPMGTQLVWVSGDVFSDKMAVELEIPSTGFPPSEEIDIAVDFRAPSMPGRYLSYWRLASPHGQKFGQRVWVLIQVENHGSFLENGAAPQFNRNAANSTEGTPKPVAEVHNSNPDSSHVNVELDKASSDGTSGRNTFPIELVSQASIPMASGPFMPKMAPPPPYSVTDSSTVTSRPASSPVSFIPFPVVDPNPSSAPPQVNSSVSYPVIDPALASSPSQPVASATPFEPMLDSASEQALLKDLEELGFKEEELNREMLRNNNYDLEQSVNNLCNVAEWNPVLDGLEEMGFLDKKKNIKLLAKNDGSFKQTVLDLISGKY